MMKDINVQRKARERERKGEEKRGKEKWILNNEDMFKLNASQENQIRNYNEMYEAIV